MPKPILKLPRGRWLFELSPKQREDLLARFTIVLIKEAAENA